MSEAGKIENAILTLARDPELLARVRTDPGAAAEALDIDSVWATAIVTGDRDRLRSAGVNDGITILVSRWFNDDYGDSTSQGRFTVNDASPLPPADVPAGLVFAGGCSHVPDLLARPEIDPEDSVSRLLVGYQRLAKDLAAAEPDVVLVTADCHFQSFRTGHFVIGTGSTHSGSMEFFKRPDLDLTLTGEPAMARSMAAMARAAGLEVEEADRVDLDHGLIVPLRLLLPRPDLPVIPIITQPARAFSPYNARAFGTALRELVVESGRRVAMLATGGLSHWLDPGKFGHVDVEFDTYVLEMLQAGRGLDLGSLEPYPLLDHGQYEFLNWLIMLGLVGPGVRGEVYAYEPMTASGGGWTVVRMDLPAASGDGEVAA
jgi:protocatechuate 4,5-dioxygenase beta chain